MVDQSVQENNVQMNESSAQESNESIDYKSLYLSEIANAKKLRNRAQVAEDENKSLKSKMETDAEKKMRKNQEFRELADKYKTERDQAMEIAQKWNDYKTSKKESLLAKLPDEDREALKNKDLETIEYFASRINKPSNNPNPVPGTARSEKVVKNYNELSEEDKRNNWEQIVNSFR